MAARVSQTTIDAHDPYALAAWWKQVLDYVDLDDEPNAPGDDECEIRDPASDHRLLFQRVPEDKVVKNRIHLDIAPTDRRRDEECERIRGLGARELADHRNPDGTGWVVFADPEGNEFCVLRSDEERAATP